MLLAIYFICVIKYFSTRSDLLFSSSKLSIYDFLMLLQLYMFLHLIKFFSLYLSKYIFVHKDKNIDPQHYKYYVEMKKKKSDSSMLQQLLFFSTFIIFFSF